MMKKFSDVMNSISKMWKKLNVEEKNVLAMLIAGTYTK